MENMAELWTVDEISHSQCVFLLPLVCAAGFRIAVFISFVSLFLPVQLSSVVDLDWLLVSALPWKYTKYRCIRYSYARPLSMERCVVFVGTMLCHACVSQDVTFRPWP